MKINYKILKNTIAFALFIIPIIVFKNGVFAGGESYMTINPLMFLRAGFYTWNGGVLGLPNLYFIPQLYHYFCYLLNIIFTLGITQKILFGASLSLSFLSMTSLLSYIFKNNNVSILISALFYVFNPFFIMMFPWFPAFAWLFFITPYSIKIIIEYLDSDNNQPFILLKMLMLFLLSSVLAINVSMLGLFVLLVGLFVVFYLFSTNRSGVFMLKKILVIFLFFLAANIFWILPLSTTYKDIFGGATVYKDGTSKISLFRYPILNSLTLNEYYWFDKIDANGSYFYKYSTYYKDFSKISMLVILLLILLSYVINNKKIKKLDIGISKFLLIFIVIFILGVFLSKGNGNPFGGFYVFLLENIKFFSVYRSSDIKFPFLLSFSIPFLICFGLLLFDNNKKQAYYLFIFLNLFCVVVLGAPIIFGQALDKSNFSNIPNYWHDEQISIDSKKIDGRILLLPRNFSAFDTYKWGYSGAPLSTQMFNRTSFSYSFPYGPSLQEKNFTNLNSLYNYLELNDIGSFLKKSSGFGLKYILFRNDFDLASNYKSAPTPEFDVNNYSENVKSILDKNFKKLSTNGELDLYEIGDSFYQHIYSLAPSSSLVVEFKKINQTKYRVIIHGAVDNFSLVFSESFHGGWKTYLENYKKSSVSLNEADYKILDGNDNDQASTDELKSYINSGYISSFGDLREKNIKHTKWENNKEVFDYNEPYKIDFVSKNFNGTIQNDNLSPGSFYETWLQKPINDNNHLMVNGYANSWNINPGELCINNSKCVKNADGSYDMELVIEFWPQRLFYIGLFVSGTTLLSCLGYLIFIRIKKQKNKHEK
ncbi:MAG: alpha-(1-_3)-arabinofuranosyltransferase family protein [Candidatus Falkowbacteria bacterium]